MSGGIKAKDESVESHDEYGKRGPNATVKDQSFTHHQSFTRSNVKSRRSHPLAKFFLHI